MGLFGKKVSKFYLVFDPYQESITASCESKEVKQIAGVMPTAKYIEVGASEFYAYKDAGVVPGDVLSRPRLTSKDAK